MPTNIAADRSGTALCPACPLRPAAPLADSDERQQASERAVGHVDVDVRNAAQAVAAARGALGSAADAAGEAAASVFETIVAIISGLFS